MSNRTKEQRSSLDLRSFKPSGTFLLVVLLVLIWEAIAFTSSPSEFPNLFEVGSGLYVVFSGTGQFQFLNHVPITVARIGLAVVISLLIGIPIGIAMGSHEFSEDFLAVYILLSMSVPAFVWAFLGLLWFGITTFLVPVMVGVIVLVPYVVFNVWQGRKELESNLIEMGSVFELSQRSIWRNIYIPHLAPYLFSSTRMVVALSWKIMLVAEIFGTQRGLGFVVSEYFLSHQNDMIIAWSIPVMALILGFERLLLRVEKRQFEWRDDSQIGNNAEV